MGANLREIQEKIARGSQISREDARSLYEHPELLEVARLAAAVRYRTHPQRTVTYLVDRNINYTNVCNTDCTFCGFYRPRSSHPESYVLSREVLAGKIEEALEHGATRILLQGGHNDELPYAYYVELISWIRSRYPIQLNAFSPSEIQPMHRVSGKSYEAILSELKSVGLDGLPGGGAELLDDGVRQRVSPKKISADEWISVMEVAQSLSLTTTATMVIGFGEDIDARLNHLERLRDLQNRSIARGLEGFNAFISWTLQFNENTSMGRSRHRREFGASISDYLRNLAVARVFLDNIAHHQSSWPTAGIEVAQLGLSFGCDDIGSTMMEENVVSQAGAPTKQKWSMTAEELIDAIRDAGFAPAQRDSKFCIVEGDGVPLASSRFPLPSPGVTC
ncbi:MAG: CofH family radical SAM protein [Deltaproteobacteria bacterium]|nr:CofH family radical SAM protein [Deltaproteobacteria bacterium]